MESILEAIGNTPLDRVRCCAPAIGAELWLKLELRIRRGRQAKGYRALS